MLYPIIRRVRRPLLPLESAPAVVPVVQQPAPEPVVARHEEREPEQKEVVTAAAGAKEEPNIVEVHVSAPAMQLALTEDQPGLPVTVQEITKPNRTRNARKAKTEEPGS